MEKNEKKVGKKKKKTLERMFEVCKKRDNFSFTNDDIKKISIETEFKNHNDATHIDKISKLPDIIIENDYFVVHTGKGNHRFVKGISKGFHTFEEIEGNPITDVKYKNGIIDELNSSESNILSIAYNQRVISGFLYDYSVVPKLYNSHRTKKDFSYRIGEEKIEAIKQQIEVDFTIEHDKEVSIFEAKNGNPSEFAIYQIYLPFLYYYEQNKEKDLGIAKINCCYLLRSKIDGKSHTKIYQYKFTDPYDMTSIELVKSKLYIV